MQTSNTLTDISADSNEETISRHQTSERAYDIIVYGASGFTGKFVVEELLKHNVKIAAAGRSKEKVKKMNPSKNLKILECEVSEIWKITGQARIFLNCAGPYIFTGIDILRACIDTETHYMDITGEPLFVEKCIKIFHEEAKKKKIFAVNCCGFDSIPADIGVQHFKEHLEKKELVESCISGKNCKVNYATYSSLIHSLSNSKELRKDVRKSQSSNIKKIFKFKTKAKKYFYSERTKSYWLLFMGSDVSIVRRTQLEMNDLDLESPVNYHAYIEVGSLFNLMMSFVMMFIFYFGSKFSLTKKILLKYPSFFTRNFVKHGLTDSEIKSASFSINFYSENKKLEICGPDPGYSTTPKCLVACALVLNDYLSNSKKNSKNKNKTGFEIFGGGVLTPGMAFYNTDLVERLNDSGIKFKITEEILH